LQRVAEQYSRVGVHESVSAAGFGGHFDTPLRQYLASRMVDMVARFNRLPDMSRADIDLLGADIARFIRAELANMDDADMGEYQTL
ncbi:replication endonuclease, partial [Klebsiella pneumoniae]|nr:replication endonuclease [Klebsiella pneumoniae]